MPEETQIPIRIIRMTQPPAEEHETAIYPVAGNVAGIRNGMSDLRLRFSWQSFIGVENEDPLVLERKIFERPIFLLRPGPVEFELNNDRAMLLRDSRRVVRAMRIDHEDFIRPLNTS